MMPNFPATLLVWCAVAGSAVAGDNGSSARIQGLENALLAPCCYEEPVARHQSEIAVKMRLEIAEWVRQGFTDEEILGRYASRYGSRILADPATRPKDWSYLMPWTMIITAAIGVCLLIWRWRRRSALARSAAVGATDSPVPLDLDD
jgi:cytochrome c-type biogenesis protein CcmH/NrfF